MKLVSLLDIHLVQKFNQAYIKCQLKKKMKMWANEVAPWIPSPESTWCRERTDTFKLSSGFHMHAYQHIHINKVSERKMKCVFLSTQLINSASRAVWFFFLFFLISVWKIKPWCEGLVYKYSYSYTHLLPLIRRWPLGYQTFFLEDMVTVLPVKQYRLQELYNMLFIVVIGKAHRTKIQSLSSSPVGMKIKECLF